MKPQLSGEETRQNVQNVLDLVNAYFTNKVCGKTYAQNLIEQCVDELDFSHYYRDGSFTTYAASHIIFAAVLEKIAELEIKNQTEKKHKNQLKNIMKPI